MSNKKQLVESKKELIDRLFILKGELGNRVIIVYEKKLDIQDQIYLSEIRNYYEDCRYLIYSRDEDFKIIKELVFPNEK